MNQYTAAIQRDGELWFGWIEALEMNRQAAKSAAGSDFEEVRISA